MYILLCLFIGQAIIKGTLQLKKLHNSKSSMFLLIAAMVNHVEVKIGKSLALECRLNKYLNLKKTLEMLLLLMELLLKALCNSTIT